MRNRIQFAVGLLVVGMTARGCIAADTPKPDQQLQEITKAHQETVKRVGDLQDYKPTPEELAANAIRVEKHVTTSEKTGKIKMVSYRTFRGNRLVKQYIECDTNDDGEIDLFMEMFRAGSEVCAALSRSTRASGSGSGTSVSSQGVSNISVTFTDKDSDGKFDELLLMRDTGEFVEHFRRDADGLMQPVSAEEYLQAQRTVQALAPFMGATMKAIESVKEQKSETPPNKSVEPTPTR